MGPGGRNVAYDETIRTVKTNFTDIGDGVILEREIVVNTNTGKCFSTYTKYYEKRKMVRGPKLMQTDHNSLNIDIHLNKYLICHSFKAHLTINILFPFELKMFFIENLIQEVMLEQDHQRLSNLLHLQL